MWREVYRENRSSSLEHNIESSMDNTAFEEVDLEEVDLDDATDGAVMSKEAEATTAKVNRVEAQIVEEHDGPYAGMGKDVLLKYSQATKWRVARWLCAILIVCGWCVMLAMAIFIIVTTPKCLPWWQLSTIYQIYPRSFCDSNGDGIGDFQGIIEKTGYLSSLGIGAVLLNSIYANSGKDYGYDVTDFLGVDKDLGTMKDFENLLEAMHDNDIKVILDFIPNHSSNQHPWFIASRNSDHKDHNVYHSFYTWAEPNNWVSLYSGEAWDRDETRGKHYLHQYSKYQPDLNFAHDPVYNQITAAMEKWFILGVDGFNMHDMSYIYEDQNLDNETKNENFSGPTEPKQYDSLLHYNTAEYQGHEKGTLHDLLRKWRSGLFDQYSTVGTYRLMLTDSKNSTYAHTYYGTANQPQAELPQNFNLVKLGNPLGEVGIPTTGNMVKELIDDWMDRTLPEENFWPNFVLGNHEVHRVASRLGPLYGAASNMLLLTLPGTPICYYGDEIGMEDIVMTKNTTLDIKATNDLDNWKEKTRDPERSPMQWTAEPNAGFSTNESGTWLPVNDNYKETNVATMEGKDWSILHMFKSLVNLRKTERAFQNADIHHVLHTEEVVSYLRQASDGTGNRYFIAVNFGTKGSEEDYYAVDNTLPIQGSVVISTNLTRQTEREKRVELNKLHLSAGEGLVVQLDKTVDRPEALATRFKMSLSFY